MGLFSQSCPLEKSHIAVYGIHSPKVWKKEDCLVCEYVNAGKCNYKQIMSQHEKLVKRGYPALVKKSLMDKPAEAREKSEKEAVKQAGFSAGEQADYWTVSKDYDRLWEGSPAESRQEILDGLGQWRVYLEKGYGPTQANDKVKEWLRARAEFRKAKSE
jgi:hypothetical protein